jgi:hypothetical protein
MINWPDIKCKCEDDCLCPPQERALRAWAYEGYNIPMTEEQKEWCLKEIDSVEGFTREHYKQASDALVALGVLDAWTAYCRDKGLL